MHHFQSSFNSCLMTISQGIARIAAPSTFHVAKVDWEIPVKSKDDHLKALVRIDWISTKAIAFRWIYVPCCHQLGTDLLFSSENSLDILSLIPSSLSCYQYHHRNTVTDTIIVILSLISLSMSLISSSVYCHRYHHRYLVIDTIIVILLSISSSI